MLSREIKKLLNSLNAKSTVKTHGSYIYVHIFSPVSDEVINQIKSMSTQEAHGSMYDDTRYFTGQGIQVSCKWEPSQEEINQAIEYIKTWSVRDASDIRYVMFHIQKNIHETVLAKINLYELVKQQIGE